MLPARSARLAVLVAACGLAVGCAGMTGRRDVSSWLEARGADAMDVVGLRVAVGPGLGVLARATEYVQLGAMYRGPSETHLAGASDVAGAGGARPRAVPCVVVGTIGRYGGIWYDSMAEVAVPGFSTRDGRVPVIAREVVAGAVSLDGSDDNWRWSFGAGVHALLVGAEAEVRPLELIDLLAGLVGYDPSGDDVPVAPSEAAATSSS